MQVQVCKWGHSLAVRIPAGVLAQAKVKEGSRLDVTVAETGAIALTPLEAALTLTQLLDAVTPANLHRETDSGHAVGNELW